MPGFYITGSESFGPGNAGYVQHQHRWEITKLGPINKYDALYAKSIVLPVFRSEKQEILGSSLVYKFAKSVNWQDVIVSFYDVGVAGVIDGLKEWRYAVHNVSDGIGRPYGDRFGRRFTGYKQDCIFKLLDGMGNVNRRIVLHNAWPISIDDGRVDYEVSDIKLITVTLSYDWADTEVDAEDKPSADNLVDDLAAEQLHNSIVQNIY